MLAPWEKRTPLFGQNYLEVKDQILVPAAAKGLVTEVEHRLHGHQQDRLQDRCVGGRDPGKSSAAFQKLRSGERCCLKPGAWPNTMMGLPGW